MRSSSTLRAHSRRGGRNSVGQSPGDGLYPLSTCWATVILWTSVGPSTIDIDGAHCHISENGISFDTPSAPCRCIERHTMSFSTEGIMNLIAAMSLRSSL